MNWSTVVSLFRTVLYGWAVSLWEFLRSLCQLLHRGPKVGPEHLPTSPTNCVTIDHPALVRPDPLLYSQRYLHARGLAVTWNNPDIVLFRGGVPVSSAELEPGITYNVNVRIWNNSLEAPVIAMPVHLTYREFGVGTQNQPIASDTVDVGVKGSSDQPGFVSIPWTTPVTPGHYCLQVLLDPADDVDRSNNIGQENTRVVATQSAATFVFTLRNDTRQERVYSFETDGYELPPARPCADDRTESATRLERHRRAGHPLPDGFDVQITPPAPTLAPEEAVTITATVEPPAGFQGRQAININAFYDQGFAGGVTVTVVKEP
jgi:hypothetical protein